MGTDPRIKTAKKEIALVEDALRKGYPPVGIAGSHEKSAIRVVSDALGVGRWSFENRIGKPGLKGRYEKQYGLVVDWSLYKPPSDEHVEINSDEQSDAIDRRRLIDEISRLRATIRDLERRAAASEEWRNSILNLADEPIRPKLIVPSSTGSAKGRRTVILHLSDIHYGETIRAEEMDGVNRYSIDIAKLRLGRFFGNAASLMTKHWSGKPPEEIILCLGGDLISGMIHAELNETNAVSLPHSVRDVGEQIAGGIALLLQNVKCPIRVYSVPGNHARITMKPQSKGRADSSLDLLATDFAEAGLRNVKGVTFYRPASPDAYFSTYGWHWCLTHGDTMGGRGGGTGFIGPIAAISKGHRKLVDSSWRSGRPIHFVLTGHYHTTAKTSFGWANGSVCGYGEYARDLRADPEPARQNFLVVHPEHGVINEQPLYLGHPSEGSLYMGPASVVRPQWEPDAD